VVLKSIKWLETLFAPSMLIGCGIGLMLWAGRKKVSSLKYSPIPAKTVLKTAKILGYFFGV